MTFTEGVVLAVVAALAFLLAAIFSAVVTVVAEIILTTTGVWGDGEDEEGAK